MAPPHEPDASLEALLAAPVDLRTRLEGPYLKVELGAGLALRLDGEGRWGSLRAGDRFLRRRLDGGACLTRPGPVPQDLPADTGWHEVARTLARRAAASLPPGAGELARRLGAAEAWTPARFAAEHLRFNEAYPEPVPILPPDRYRDLVVLPAIGCPYGQCAFCAWYRDARFTILEGGAFETHLERVLALFGRGVGARNGLFLGSASAFSVPDEVLLADLTRVAARLGRFERGIAGFLDPDHAPRRESGAWRRLAEAGVSRVVMGLETGDPELRRRLAKAGPERLVETAAALEGAGISVALSVLAGAWEPEEDARHEAATAGLVAALGLGPKDLVYVSPYSASSRSPAALAAAASRLAAALRGATRAKVAPYRMDLYRYFA